MKAIYNLKYTEIKDGLNQGKWTSEEIINSYLERIQEFEPKIKAFLSIEKDFIISHGCDYAQGYYYKPPDTPDKIFEFLKNLPHAKIKHS